ncbi:MAG: hypothetical protein H6799_00715 [Candidatus Nomurabacteria bacterium]|nr:MAG: hypothetical protein H6799_00715 [Candidatus Nomurabacteria bacterium]HRV76126.1 hypothetical protein [Candidatus Saccharimonadales bacterium]
MADPLEKKIARRKEKKKRKKQQEVLNNVSEGRWRRMGSFAAWVGYRVSIDGETEVVPVRKNANRFSLLNSANNLKRYIKKRKTLEKKRKKRKSNNE